MGRIDAERLEIADGRVGECVVADVGDHDDFGAEFGRGHGLIGALAAVAHLEARRGDSFAARGHAVNVGDEVDHVAADDADARGAGGYVHLLVALP